MPWAPSDAKKHKAGLSTAQAKKWASIANAVLAQCQKDKGSDCEGKAIRIANSQVGKSVDGRALALVVKAQITKSDPVRRRIFGYASVAVQKSGQPLIDLQGDLIDIAELAEGWYGYVKSSGRLNWAHEEDCEARLIEAIVFTPDKLEALGLAPDALPLAAWVGYEFDTDADFQRMHDADYLMFSIQGFSETEEV